MGIAEDIIHVLSIIASFTVLIKTDGGELQQLLSLPTDSVSIYILIFTLFLMANQVFSWLKSRKPKEEELPQDNHPNPIKNQTNFILALVIATCLAKAHESYSENCGIQQITTILLWFVLARMLQSLGQALNSRSSIKSWNVFGDSMSAFVCLIAIGCASGVEVFDYI